MTGARHRGTRQPVRHARFPVREPGCAVPPDVRVSVPRPFDEPFDEPFDQSLDQSFDLAGLVALAETARELWSLHAERRLIAQELGSASNGYLVDLVRALRAELAQLIAASRTRIAVEQAELDRMIDASEGRRGPGRARP